MARPARQAALYREKAAAGPSGVNVLTIGETDRECYTKCVRDNFFSELALNEGRVNLEKECV